MKSIDLDAVLPGKTLPLEKGFGADSPFEGLTQLICPKCGFDYVHPAGDAVFLKNADKVTRTPRACTAILVPLFGECGHRWFICIEFSKGHAYAYTAEGVDIRTNTLQPAYDAADEELK